LFLMFSFIIFPKKSIGNIIKYESELHLNFSLPNLLFHTITYFIKN
jgi:hypothetical protein